MTALLLDENLSEVNAQVAATLIAAKNTIAAFLGDEEATVLVLGGGA